MELTKVKVDGLYGIFDHEIKFDKFDKMTILIGQNGLGKTVILRLIKCFFDREFNELKALYFSNFLLYFSDEVTIKVVRTLVEDEPQIMIECFLNNESIETPYAPKEIINRRRYKNVNIYQREMYDYEYQYDSEIDYLIDKFVPGMIRKVEPGIWLDVRRKMHLNLNDILERYQEFFPPDILEKFKFPPWLKKYTEKAKVRIIETQRLLNKIKTEDGKYKSAVNEYSQEIIDTIKSKRAAASDLASKLDRTYPKRLLEKLRDQEDIKSIQLEEKLVELEKRRKDLNVVGLIDTEEEYMQPYIQFFEDKIIKNVLLQYINDSNEKLQIYEDLEKRISLFLDIVNKRFLYKTFKIDKLTGFKFNSTVTSKEIPLSGLSSGEQHELVLFYQLLFNTNAGSFLLIDEPEISLHISWQNKFLDDLKRVILINPMDILIATHSPDIIGNYWNLAIQLQGLNLEENDK